MATKRKRRTASTNGETEVVATENGGIIIAGKYSDDDVAGIDAYISQLQDQLGLEVKISRGSAVRAMVKKVLKEASE